MSKIDPSYLFQDVPPIKEEILNILEELYQKEKRFPLDEQFYTLMKTYTTSGKVFRGCLIVRSYVALSGKEPTVEIYKIAAAVELCCSGLLIQDDIMDKDEKRRGLPTIHKTMESWAEERGYSDFEHFGKSITLCFYAVLFFVCFSVLNSVKLPARIRQKLLAISSAELPILGLAQAEDMRQASSPFSEISKADITAMQYGKTGRYTGRWPLEIGAALAGCSAVQIKKIGTIGDELGLLYQLRDDYLGVFGVSEATGKNALTDIREGKKTLYYYYATQLWKDTAYDKTLQFFGKKNATLDEVEQVKIALEKSGVAKIVQNEIADRMKALSSHIAESTMLTQAAQNLLQDILGVFVSREK